MFAIRRIMLRKKIAFLEDCFFEHLLFFSKQLCDFACMTIALCSVKNSDLAIRLYLLLFTPLSTVLNSKKLLLVASSKHKLILATQLIHTDNFSGYVLFIPLIINIFQLFCTRRYKQDFLEFFSPLSFIVLVFFSIVSFFKNLVLQKNYLSYFSHSIYTV